MKMIKKKIRVAARNDVTLSKKQISINIIHFEGIKKVL